MSHKLNYIDDNVAWNNYNVDHDDQSGNLIADVAESITSITWTPDGKVRSILKHSSPQDTLISFLYDATGSRVVKSVKGNGFTGYSSSFTYYLRDANTKPIAIYQSKDYASWQEYAMVNEWNIYGSKSHGRFARKQGSLEHPDTISYSFEGFWFPPDSSYERRLMFKEYEHQDHLSNVRLVYSDLKLAPLDINYTPMSFTLNLRAVDNYYPFGMLMPERTFNSMEYRFGFQGQEKDDEIFSSIGTAYLYKYRMYDSRVGRFWSVDPMCADFPWNSPFAFSENRVIDGIEFEGLEVVLINPEESVIHNAAVANTNSSAIHIYAHGNYTGIRNRSPDLGEKANWVDTRSEFETILQMSDQYLIQKNSGKMIVILHSCNSGNFAQKMSKETGATIIGVDSKVFFSRTDGEIGPWIDREDGIKGNWLIFNEGVLISAYSGDWNPVATPTVWDDFLYKRDLTFKVSTSALNLRTGAGTSYSTNGDPLANGSILRPTGNIENGWMEVNTEGGRTGWVSAKYTEAVFGRTGTSVFVGTAAETGKKKTPSEKGKKKKDL